ncbi:MAG TPA: S1/P1 nuclease [Thermoanaerobaculia bacterium]|nr:S1/P1 nuclease [Thermoanaerobaculia bacterium]
MKRVPLALLISLTLAPAALAWGPDGHRIVCRIAYDLLDESQQQEVDRLTDLYTMPDDTPRPSSFPHACIFADDARAKARDGVEGWTRFNRFNDWHFLNVPREVRHVGDEFCDDDCVTFAIGFHEERLGRKTLGDQKRAEALFFLGHWVGDVHQPLHVSFSDDLGGNNIKPIHGGLYKSKNLHSVWDSGILMTAEGEDGWRVFADRLAEEIGGEQQSAWTADMKPIAWAEESYAITTSKPVDYCEWVSGDEGDWCRPEHHIRTLKQAYQDRFDKTVEERLQMAGVRLAELIRSSLAK